MRTTILSLFLPLLLLFGARAQCNSCDPNGSGHFSGCSAGGFQLESCNVQTVACSYCDTRGWVDPFTLVYHGARLSLNSLCVHLGVTPTFQLQSGNMVVPSNSTLYISYDAAQAVPPVFVTSQMQSPWPGATQSFAFYDCRLNTLFAAYSIYALPTGIGGSTMNFPWPFGIPNDPAFLGAAIFSQAFVLTPGAQPALVMSNTIQATVVP